jgi:hypothetical protein
LKGKKAVVRQIAIESVNDPFTVMPRIRVEEFGVIAHLVGLVLSITGQREPKARHPLSEPPRGQQALDQTLVSIGARVPEKSFNFAGRGRKSGQVEGDSADERSLPRFGGRLISTSFKPRENEIVDGLPRPSFIGDTRPRLGQR